MAERDGKSIGEEAWLGFDSDEKSQSNECRMQKWIAAEWLSSWGFDDGVGEICSLAELQTCRVADLLLYRKKCR